MQEVKIKKSFSLSTHDLLKFLRDLIKEKVVKAPYTHYVTVKAGDLRRIGLNDRWSLTKFGRVLNAFSELGYATPANSRRPVRYVVNELGIRWALICTWPECNPNCGLRSVCPYQTIVDKR